MSSSNAVVETIGLTKRFTVQHGWRSVLRSSAQKTALHDIDLRIEAGEVFGLLGPNGAGKTTLVKILCSLIYPSHGQVLVCGYDVVRRSREVRQRVGVVYGDERTFFLRLSALENLRFYATLYGLSRARAEQQIERLLDLVGMTAAASVRMQQYSSGMKQRIAIARGLLNEPDLLIMDEPTHNLDPLAAREVRDLVRERVADGRRTVILATNIMAEAEDLCTRLAILHHGRLQLSGSIDQLRLHLQAEEAHQLELSCSEGVIDTLTRLAGVRSVVLLGAEGDRRRLDVTVQRGTAAIPLLLRSVVESGGSIWSSTPRELSLEEMFEIAIQRAQSTGGDQDHPPAGASRFETREARALAGAPR